MADPCKNCGTELFAGQRFCRACGNPTDTLDAGEAPTQQFADGAPSAGEATTRHMSPPDDWGARSVTHTAPQSRPNTNPVGRPPDTYQPPHQTPQGYQAPPTAYQMPPQPPAWQAAQYAPQAQPARSGSSWAIVLAIILALMLGAMMAGRAIFRRVRERIPAAGIQQNTPAAEDTQTVALNKGAAVTIKAISGSITVEGWDQPQAEVRIIRSSDVPASAVTFRHDDNSLYLEVPQSLRNGKVSFEVKLPRQLGVVSFNSVSGPIKISDVDGKISLTAVSGSITLDDVTGLDDVKSVSGSITANLGDAAKDRPMNFESVSGSVTLNLPNDFNATLDAHSISGRIDADGVEGVKVDRSGPVGSHATGPIGAGGPNLGVKTVSGRIKINK